MSGAQRGNRTLTLKELEPKSSASTNSAIWAMGELYAKTFPLTTLFFYGWPMFILIHAGLLLFIPVFMADLFSLSHPLFKSNKFVKLNTL